MKCLTYEGGLGRHFKHFVQRVPRDIVAVAEDEYTSHFDFYNGLNREILSHLSTHHITL